MNKEIIRMEHITKRFPLGGGRMLTAVDDITFLSAAARPSASWASPAQGNRRSPAS